MSNKKMFLAPLKCKIGVLSYETPLQSRLAFTHVTTIPDLCRSAMGDHIDVSEDVSMNPVLYRYAMAVDGCVLLMEQVKKSEKESYNEQLEDERKRIKELEGKKQTRSVTKELGKRKKRAEELENPHYTILNVEVQFGNELTPNHNTILHVAVQFGHVNNVKWFIEKCPELVLRQNTKGETPLHMAAREGQDDIVKELILGAQRLDLEGGDEKVKEMLKLATCDEKDTALHMAARNCHLKGDYLAVVLKLLLKEGETPSYWNEDFQHLPNKAKETPLYLAAERGKKGQEVVLALLKTCDSPNHFTGPGGRTALHAIAFHYKDFQGESERNTIQILLKQMKHLIKIKEDVSGWIPLQYAACSGNVLVMEELLSLNPDCWEMVDKNGQNILHIAVDMNMKSVIDYIVEQPWFRHLINQKNKDGDTPLHLLVTSDYKVGKLWKSDLADKHVFNGEDMTPIDLIWSSFKKTTYDIEDETFWGSESDGGRIIAFQEHDNLAKFKRFKEERRKAAAARIEARKTSMEVYQSLVVVAALIAAISSAAAFAIPGGYDGNQGRDQGMAVLVRAAAFKAFVITNTIALSSSVTSILLCLNALYFYSINKGVRDITLRYEAAGFLIFVAIFSLMLAFITAAFAVLAHSRVLVVFTCIIVCIGFIGFFLGMPLCQLGRAKDKDSALAVQRATNNVNRAMNPVQRATSSGNGDSNSV